MEKIRADLHNHLRTGSDMPKDIFNRAIDISQRKLGNYGIIVLVNFADKRYEAFSELRGYDRQDFGNALYVPEKRILVVKGQEVPTKQGHLLVLGLMKRKSIPGDMSLEDTIKSAKDNNGIIIADHPFYLEGIGQYLAKNPELVKELDALEIHNSEAALWIPGITPRNANNKSKEFYINLVTRRIDIGAVATSDGHTLHEIGNSFTWLDMPEYQDIKNSEELAGNLKKAVRKTYLFDCEYRDAKSSALWHIMSLLKLNGLSILDK